VVLWRISNHASLAGDGGMRAAGRWHTRGRRIVYCSETPAAALLEILVHFEMDVFDLPARYRLLQLDAPDTVAIERLAPADLPQDWVARTSVTRALGDRWLQERRTALLRVPSAIVPDTFNVLLNPGNAEAGRIAVMMISEHPIDPRLVKPAGSRARPF
jgi:RES domain-containing protein